MSEAKVVVEQEELGPVDPVEDTAQEETQEVEETVADSEPSEVWKFEKMGNVRKPVVFDDGSSFTFPVIVNNTTGRPQTWSSVEVTDPELAAKLAAKDGCCGVVDVNKIVAARAVKEGN